MITVVEGSMSETVCLFVRKGYAYDPDCMYINGTGRDYYEFYIQLNRCGTLGKNTHHEDSRKSPTVSADKSRRNLRARMAHWAERWSLNSKDQGSSPFSEDTFS